ncbi:MAG: mannose-1-phosphate guanylyltransferase [Vicingaceae bacterium]
MDSHAYGVIMAGGIGSRFWPMSTEDHPKQFIDILGTGQSLLQQTFERLSNICPADQIYIVTNEQYREITKKQLPGINDSQVLCEPMRRNTAPCIAYANFKIMDLDSKANVLVCPSDHLITKESVFNEVISQSLKQAATKDVLLTIGIKPSRPDTGYGYINYEKTNAAFSKVISFTEKPDLETAKKFVASGDYSWNSGMFIWNVNSIDKAFRELLPEMHLQFEKGKGKYNTEAEQAFINQVYPSCENISIDYGIMEKAGNRQVINADFGWSDLGTWGSLYEHIPQDQGGNALIGKKVMSLDARGNIVHVPNEKLVVMIGLDDCIVVEHGNALLICKKEEEQKIKKITEGL